MIDDAPDPHDPRYRRNVGIVVFNPEGRVWLGRRHAAAGPSNWQFPQGGVDEGEPLLAAARRELQEETGITSVSLLARADGWITYDFPPEVAQAPRQRFVGQAQAWFAFRFDGQDKEVDLNAHTHPEFDAWRWVALNDVLDTVVAFKRAAYEQVIAAFSGLMPRG